ncbi:hypothetical protein BCR32DRAFT_288135 [Anaeromyces robustus]|uniref:Uncharacterized protein n=1 Tax=Anaeromyces robustus TaxID=1754192 RepID=A0A1Y1VB66_9FUNG|nr:hypothetical protein BCR32DRAFT_288135 [Anaeromyces robustus]|eukprot:ORX51733.1 hypothetical protein BCR32DRAFT_288135 [Anaeromyces robustus]
MISIKCLKVAQNPDKYENFKFYATNTYYSLKVAQNPVQKHIKNIKIKYLNLFYTTNTYYSLKVAQKPDKYENFKIYATNTYYSLNVAQNPLKSCAKSCLITIYLLKKTRSKNINIWLCYAKKYHKKFSQSHLIYLSKNINIWLCYAKKYNENFSQPHLIYLLSLITIYPLEKTRSENINIQLGYAKKYNEKFSQSHLIYLLKVAQNPV